MRRKQGGGAGGSGAGAGIGEPCLGSCQPGLICSGAIFDRLCTVQCGGDSACEQFSTNARCFGGECALRCDTSADCPAETTCAAVSGGTTPMACIQN